MIRDICIDLLKALVIRVYRFLPAFVVIVLFVGGAALIL